MPCNRVLFDVHLELVSVSSHKQKKQTEIFLCQYSLNLLALAVLPEIHKCVYEHNTQ